MQNPNATVAAVSAAITVAAQWLVQKYAHVALTGYWATAVTSGVTVAVLYVGKHGIKAALARLWAGPRKAWAGVSQEPAKP